MSSKQERRVSKQAVVALARYAGLDLPAKRVDLLRAEVQRFLEAIRCFDDLPLDGVQPAGTYRLFWEEKP